MRRSLLLISIILQIYISESTTSNQSNTPQIQTTGISSSSAQSPCQHASQNMTSPAPKYSDGFVVGLIVICVLLFVMLLVVMVPCACLCHKRRLRECKALIVEPKNPRPKLPAPAAPIGGVQLVNERAPVDKPIRLFDRIILRRDPNEKDKKQTIKCLKQSLKEINIEMQDYKEVAKQLAVLAYKDNLTLFDGLDDEERVECAINQMLLKVRAERERKESNIDESTQEPAKSKANDNSTKQQQKKINHKRKPKQKEYGNDRVDVEASPPARSRSKSPSQEEKTQGSRSKSVYEINESPKSSSIPNSPTPSPSPTLKTTKKTTKKDIPPSDKTKSVKTQPSTYDGHSAKIDKK